MSVASFFNHLLHRPHSTIGDGYHSLIVSHYPYVDEPPPAKMRVLGEGPPDTPYTFATVLQHKKRPYKGGMPIEQTWYGKTPCLALVPKIKGHGEGY